MQPDQENNYWKNDEQSDDNNISGMYAPENTDDDTETNENDNIQSAKIPTGDQPVHWSSQEYISDEKNTTWFIIFGIVVLVLILASIFILKDYFTFPTLIIIMAASVIVYARRPAKNINYTLSGDQGLYIDEKLYHFSDFKAFGLLRDHGQHSIMLIPNKRFSPAISVYFPEEAGERIVDILGTRLPMEKLKLDVIDIIVQKLRL